jgi:NitT/TauT family transport system substrate-binding protein
MRKRLVVWGCLLMMLSAAPARAGEPLLIGILPVLDTLPLQVAVHDKCFQDQGLEVTLVPFNSAIERDVAMQSGHLDGYFGDLINTLLLIKNKVPMRIVTTSYRSTPGQPASLIRTEVKKIPIRLQMLLAGQLDLAVLPEPLVTLAQKSGSKVIVTDETLDIPLTVLCLHDKVKARRPGMVAVFLKAYGVAVFRINSHPEEYRQLMAATCRIPKPLVADYPIPRYPEPWPPEQAAVEAVEQWMIGHGMLKHAFDYNSLIAPQ